MISTLSNEIILSLKLSLIFYSKFNYIISLSFNLKNSFVYFKNAIASEEIKIPSSLKPINNGLPNLQHIIYFGKSL